MSDLAALDRAEYDRRLREGQLQSVDRIWISIELVSLQTDRRFRLRRTHLTSADVGPATTSGELRALVVCDCIEGDGGDLDLAQVSLSFPGLCSGDEDVYLPAHGMGDSLLSAPYIRRVLERGISYRWDAVLTVRIRPPDATFDRRAHKRLVKREAVLAAARQQEQAQDIQERTRLIATSRDAILDLRAGPTTRDHQIRFLNASEALLLFRVKINRKDRLRAAGNAAASLRCDLVDEQLRQHQARINTCVDMIEFIDQTLELNVA